MVATATPAGGKRRTAVRGSGSGVNFVRPIPLSRRAARRQPLSTTTVNRYEKRHGAGTHPYHPGVNRASRPCFWRHWDSPRCGLAFGLAGGGKIFDRRGPEILAAAVHPQAHGT